MRTFSLPQTVTLVAGACLLALLVPTSVNAAGSAMTRITDGKGPVAKVDPAGNLAVGDGAGPLTVDGAVAVTGTVAVTGPVGVTGQVGVTSLPPVSGSVEARPAPATQPWMNVNGTALNAADPTEVLYSGQVNHRLNLTTFSASATAGSAGSVTLYASVLVGAPGDTCDNTRGGSFAAAERFTIVVPVGDTVVETFPSPLSWTQYGQGQDRFCVELSGSGPSGWTVNVLANGFIS